MGQAIAELGWPRWSYVISTKVFWGIHDAPNMQQHAQPQVPDAGDRRLARAHGPRLRRPAVLPPRRPGHADRGDGVGHVRHRRRRARRSTGAPRSGPPTRSGPRGRSPSATTCTSRSMEQPQYNLFERRRVEQEYARLYDDIGLGLTTWSPLASGLLTGKYLDGIPDDSRAALPGYEWLRERAHRRRAQRQGASAWPAVAERLGCTLAQLAIAWCAANPQRVDGDHRRQPGRAGAREPGRPRRAGPSSPPRCWPRSRRSSADGARPTALAFVRDHRQGVLVTLKRRDGRPQLSNIMYAVDDDGLIRISVTADPGQGPATPRATRGSRSTSHARTSTPTPSSTGRPSSTAVTTEPGDAAGQELADLYRPWSGEHEDWDEYFAAMVRDQPAGAAHPPERAYGMLPS